MLAELNEEAQRDYPQTHHAPVECDVVEKADADESLCEAWQGLEQGWRTDFTPPPPQKVCVFRERENGKLK